MNTFAGSISVKDSGWDEAADATVWLDFGAPLRAK